MSWYNASWDYRIKVTVDKDQVDSDLDNFPVYVDLSDLPSEFFTNVKSDGSDIRVTESDGSTELPREVVSIDTSGETGELHFKASGTGGLSSSTDTEFYIYYGNGSASEPASDATYGAENVWDSNYIAVYHLESDFNDSTSNNNNATNQGSSNTAVQLGDGQGFNGSSDYIQAPTNIGLSSEITFECWSKTDTLDSNYRDIWSYDSDSEGVFAYMYVRTGENIAFGCNDGDYKRAYGTINTSDNFHVVGTIKENDYVRIYVNGSQDDSTAVGTLTDIVWDTVNDIGRFDDTGRYFDGNLDEIRISDVERGANWISASYTNQNTPTTFYTVGSQETGSTDTNDEISAKTTGKTTANSEISSKTTGSETLSTDQIEFTFTSGTDVNDEVSAKVTGKTSTNDEIPSSLTGGYKTPQYLYWSKINSENYNILKVVVHERDVTTPSDSSIDWHVSADGGSNWESVTAEVAHDIVNPGNDLRVRATLNASTDLQSSPTVNEISVVWTEQQAVDTNSEITAKLTGKDTTSNEISAKTTGKQSDNSEISAKTIGKQIDNSEINAKLTGKDSTSDEVSSKLTGQQSISSEIESTLKGKDTAIGEISSKLTGTAIPADDEITSKLTGKQSDNSEIDSRLTGKQDDANEKQARLVGKQTDSDEVSSRLIGKDTDQSEIQARLVGKQTDNSQVSAKIAGKEQDSSEKSAKLTGKSSDESEIAVRLVGEQDSSSEVQARLKGNDQASSQISAKTRGKLTAQDEVSAKLTGKDTSSSEKQSKLTGKDSTNSTIDVRLTGQKHTSSDVTSRLTGKDTSSSDKQAKLTGKQATQNEKQARLVGQEHTSSEIGSKLHGQKIDSSEINSKLTGKRSDSNEVRASITGIFKKAKQIFGDFETNEFEATLSTDRISANIETNSIQAEVEVNKINASTKTDRIELDIHTD